MELYIRFLENVTKRQKINNEQEGAKDKALGNTTRDWKGAGSQVLELNKLCATREICSEPSQRDVSDSNGG